MNSFYDLPVFSLNKEGMKEAIATWEPFWALPSEAVDFMRHFRICSKDREDVDRRFWCAGVFALLKDERFHVSLTSGKVIHSYFPSPPDCMIQCAGCGDIWDGFRQCGCVQIDEMMELYP